MSLNTFLKNNKIIAFAVSALLITEVIFNFVSFSQYVILKLVFEGVCFIISWMHVLIIWRARIQIQRQEDIWVYATRRPNYSQIGPLLVTDPELINQYIFSYSFQNSFFFFFANRSKLFRPSSVESRYSSFPNNQTSPEIEESNSRAIPSSSNENFGVSPPFQKPSNKRSSTILPKQERIVAVTKFLKEISIFIKKSNFFLSFLVNVRARKWCSFERK